MPTYGNRERCIDMKNIKIEICIDQAEHAHLLKPSNCHRIELCSKLEEDGLTPDLNSMGLLQDMGFEVTAMARPRSGDFNYSPTDIDRLKSDIADCVSAGADGLVLGILDSNNRVPRETLRELVICSKGLPVTFHRAFDHSANMISDLETIIETGCQRILTSGGSSFADQGRQKLSELVQLAGDRIEIIAGGGVRPGHAASLVTETGVSWIHLSARKNEDRPDIDLLEDLERELYRSDR